MGMSKLEREMLGQIKFAGLPEPEQEYRFDADVGGRQWRFDFAWPEYMIALEVEGGVYRRGRHNRASGFIEDCVKYNTALISGWKVLRAPTPMIKSGEAINFLESLFKVQENTHDVDG